VVRGRVIDQQPIGMIGNELEFFPVEPAQDTFTLPRHPCGLAMKENEH
jgi:hypothetical protein